jgi:hypothetical protein
MIASPTGGTYPVLKPGVYLMDLVGTQQRRLAREPPEPEGQRSKSTLRVGRGGWLGRRRGAFGGIGVDLVLQEAGDPVRERAGGAGLRTVYVPALARLPGVMT